MRHVISTLGRYEFTTDRFAPLGGARCAVTVTSVVGHVFTLSFVEKKENDESERDEDAASDASSGARRQTPPRRSAPGEYFELPVVKAEEATTGKLRVIDHLRAAAAGADQLVLWLDCDAEGENIAHEVALPFLSFFSPSPLSRSTPPSLVSLSPLSLSLASRSLLSSLSLLSLLPLSPPSLSSFSPLSPLSLLPLSPPSLFSLSSISLTRGACRGCARLR